MTAKVVDTNVAIVANGGDTHADVQCQLKCVRKIRFLVKEGIVAIDDKNLIIDEYRRHLDSSGEPGVGDSFLKHVFDNQYVGGRVQRVAVTPIDDERRGFTELPDNDFDPSDRKFLAVAVVAEATVLNAVDSDWQEQEALMKGLGVIVEELCPQHVRAAASVRQG